LVLYLVILNSIKDENATFGLDANKISISTCKPNRKEFSLIKKDGAVDVVKEAEWIIAQK